MLAGLAVAACWGAAIHLPVSSEPLVVTYSAKHPGLHVVDGRVIAESDPALSSTQRSVLWREYGLELEFEWVRPVGTAFMPSATLASPTTSTAALKRGVHGLDSGNTADTINGVPTDTGFTYHELRLREWTAVERAMHSLHTRIARLLGQPVPAPLPSRALPQLIAQLNEDLRVHWAAPDALLLEWADGPEPVPEETAPLSEEGDEWTEANGASPIDDTWTHDPAFPPVTKAAHEPVRTADLTPGGMLRGAYSAGLLNHEYKVLNSTGAWEDAVNAAAAQSTEDKPLAIPGPLPEFEYYRLAGPDGTLVEWAAELAANDIFARECAKVYGTHQAAALAAYEAAGRPALAPITVVIADTGVLRSHPELAAVMHPNALDCNYSSLRFPRPAELAGPGLEVVDRERDNAAGLPREAIRGKPAAHGTNCAGVVQRCTAGFATQSGVPAVRLLTASLKSDKAVAFDGGRIKTPISSFIRLVYALSENFPTGSYTPDPAAVAQNLGDVRVVSVSASVPKSYFSDAQWRIVANLAGKAAGAIAEDLRKNDRLYVFAAGNEAQGEPNKPADVDYVLSVSAARAFSGNQAWRLPQFKEGSNVGPACVSAPGEGIITSSIYPCPNLRYLPESEFRTSGSWSTPPTGRQWREQTNSFSATSSATPQVAALAALLYAQDSGRRHMEVIELIRASTAGRILTAPYGSSAGLIDYQQALDWSH